MKSQTKIIVIHMKEIIYTVIFLILAVILGLTLFFMFGPGKNISTAKEQSTRYTDGIYRSAVSLGENSFDVEVTVSSDEIRSIHLENLSESTAALFPLMEPALDSLASQIYATQSTENLRIADEQKYTSALLLSAIQNALLQAENAT